MASRIPPIDNKHRLCVICEGFEEHNYIKRLIDFDIWNNGYSFNLINAKGESNIFARYQNEYSNDNYEIILIFCDTDKKPFKEYSKLKEKINSYHNGRVASRKIIIFANPCSMQIILSHFGDVCLKSQGKKTNAKVIFDYTGIENYDAHEEQIEKVCKSIKKQSYWEMKKRIKDINLSDDISVSTNLYTYLERFENDDYRWIREINNYLKSKSL